jgi:hypothetical protein
MRFSEFSGCSTFEIFNDRSDLLVRRDFQEQMYVIWHALHFENLERVFSGDIIAKLLEVLFHVGTQNFRAVFGGEDDVIFAGVDDV